MERELKNLEKLIGKKVQITTRKNSYEFLPGLIFDSFSFNAILQNVDDSYITVKKPSGLIHLLPFKDRYVTIEKIEAQ